MTDSDKTSDLLARAERVRNDMGGAEKVAKGETSIAEVLRVAPVSSYE